MRTRSPRWGPRSRSANRTRRLSCSPTPAYCWSTRPGSSSTLYRSTYTSIYLSIYLYIYLSISQSIFLSINISIIYLFIYLSIHLSRPQDQRIKRQVSNEFDGNNLNSLVNVNEFANGLTNIDVTRVVSTGSSNQEYLSKKDTP